MMTSTDMTFWIGLSYTALGVVNGESYISAIGVFLVVIAYVEAPRGKR
jgi:hypothetical protein